MAYGITIPGRSVAANYAASFRPVSTAPGFSQVKSDLAANYLMQIPMLKQQLEMQMARDALGEAASIERTRLNSDVAMARLANDMKARKLNSLLGGGSGGDLNSFDANQQMMEIRSGGRMSQIDLATQQGINAILERERRVQDAAAGVGQGVSVTAPVQRTQVQGTDINQFILNELEALQKQQTK
tara:strand:+ start:371 stop:925 length:555 start_codon:yes stop_codon:yes gene_type:complete